MKKLIIFFFLLLLSSSAVLAQKSPSPDPAHKKCPPVQDGVFRSSSLGRDMHYRVLMPGGCDKGERLPVLYLLHGIYGDYKNWDTRTRLETYAKNLRMIIVMPDGDDSWYTNSATVPADKFEDYVATDRSTPRKISTSSGLTSAPDCWKFSATREAGRGQGTMSLRY